MPCSHIPVRHFGDLEHPTCYLSPSRGLSPLRPASEQSRSLCPVLVARPCSGDRILVLFPYFYSFLTTLGALSVALCITQRTSPPCSAGKFSLRQIEASLVSCLDFKARLIPTQLNGICSRDVMNVPAGEPEVDTVSGTSACWPARAAGRSRACP